MEKKILLFGLAALLMSCGGNKKDGLMVTPETTEIKGPLKGYYEVVQKDYAIKNNSWSDVINVELKRTDKALPFDPQDALCFGEYDAEKPVRVGFGIELLDEAGDVVEIINANATGLSGVYSTDDVDAAIRLAAGETGIVRWSVDVDNEPVSFRITSAVDESDSSQSGSSSSAVSESPAVRSSSNNWDAVLDKYEDYVDKYIATCKKAMNGDLSAATEYISLMEEAEELGDELDDASDEMTPAQISRYTRITGKLSSMASEAAGF